MTAPDELRALVESYLAELALTPELGGLGRVGAVLDRGRRQARPAGDLPRDRRGGGWRRRDGAAGGGRARARAHLLARPRRPAGARRRRGAARASARPGGATARRSASSPATRCWRRRSGWRCRTRRRRSRRELAQATLGMIGGQYLDITGTASDLASLHRLKTGCLFAASVGLGLWAAEVPEREQPPWRAFGDELGLLFQVVDDILDEDGYVLEHGTEGARQLADESAERARARAGGDRCRHERARRHRRRARGPDLLKKRLDVLLVERGLAESRAQAQALVLAGQRARLREGGPAGRRVGRADGDPAAAVRLARRREARPRARGVRRSRSRAAMRSTSAPRRAGSPTCCSSAAPRA